MPFIYVAIPYSDPNPAIREARYREANNFTLWLVVSLQVTPYSPITHWHEIAKANDMPKGFEFWKRINDDMLSGADAVYLLTLDGWNESKGVTYELEFAKRLRKPISHWEYNHDWTSELHRYNLIKDNSFRSL